MNEIESLAKIDEALGGLDDKSARLRVLDWAVAKYGDEKIELKKHSESPPNDLSSLNEGSKELPGIAQITDNGKFVLTVRDLKAKNTNDAAIRTALLTIYSYCKLTGESSLSSRKTLKPILEDRKVYTGNTRTAIANYQGIIRDGDSLSLDYHAKKEAERYIDEILKGNGLE